MHTYRYNICGLTIEFPWEIAEFPISSQAPNVFIRFGAARPPPQGVTQYHGPYCQVAPNHFFLHIESIANFMVCDGSVITIEPAGKIDTDSLKTFLLSSCLGILLIQRSLLVLHAAVLEKNGKAVAFGGGPGCGKSTLSALLLKSGAGVLADNLCVLRVDEKVTPMVQPSFPNIHLWQSTLDKLSLGKYKSKKLRPDINKYAIDLGADFVNSSLPLSTLCILSPWNKKDTKFTHITGPEKIFQLINISFRTKITRGLGLEKQHFKQISRLSSKINIVRLAYPQDWEMNGSLVNQINECLFK